MGSTFKQSVNGAWQVVLHTTLHDKFGNRTKKNQTKAPWKKAPHNEIILLHFFYIDGDIKDILKIKTHPY